MERFKNYILPIRSYTQWAQAEIIRTIKDHTDLPMAEVLERFAQRMDKYSCMNSKTSMIFSIAHDAALDMLDELIVKGAKK